mgnify:FL=1|tara:strand:+ start:13356 stop:15554 length:2199 start_codon:yes stop_codon:yes gene_type:complete
MPVLNNVQCDTIIQYLQTEALKDAVIKGPLIDDVVDLLNDSGYSIPVSNRSKPLLGTAGNTQRYAQISTMKQNLPTANLSAQRLGFSGLIECNNYTRNIQVTGKATTGTQKTSKTTPAGNTPPSRALNATFFDHNGQMAANILEIAAKGYPTASWQAAAKKVAAGTNYTSEFPVSVGPSYVIGDRGVNQMLTGTATSAPANPVTPAPPAPTPLITPVDLGETKIETPEATTPVETVVETVATPEGVTVMADGINTKMQGGLGSASSEKRRLSIPKWEERDKTDSGQYPYPLKDQPIYFLLNPASDDAALQFTNAYADADNFDVSGDDPARLTEQGMLIIQQGQKIVFTTKSNFDKGNIMGLKITEGVADSFTLKWSRPGSSEKIELFEVRNKNGMTIFKVIDGQIIELKSNYAQIGKTTMELMSMAQSIQLSEDVLQIVVTPDNSITTTNATELGYPNDGGWTEQMIQWLENNPTAGMYFYSTKVETRATVDVYEQAVEDLDGSLISADELLARIAGTVDQAMDVANKYIKVYLNFDYAGARTTDLFSGRIQDSDSRLTALIFPGDQIDLDIEGVNGELELADQVDKVMALKEVKTSTPVAALDSDGNALGYDTVSDAILTFEHNGKTKVITIPNADGELMAYDNNGEQVKGQIESIEVHSGNAAAMYETQKMIRRTNRMAPAFNLPNPSATDQNATGSVAFRIGRKYYIVGRRGGQPVLIELDLNYQQEEQ